ncbi:MAG: hypothetical protein KF691_13015 [Phycisphaeraceae bacterium]|nr:hypothetical protein [Phycisphaeraceae bacterium]
MRGGLRFNLQKTTMRSMLAVAMLVLASCGQQQPLDIIAKNKSSASVDNFTMSFAGQDCRVGALVKDGTAGMSGFPYPVTSPARVSWTDIAGAKHQKDVVLPPMDRSKPGELVFVLEGSEVSVVFRDRFAKD